MSAAWIRGVGSANGRQIEDPAEPIGANSNSLSLETLREALHR